MITVNHIRCDDKYLRPCCNCGSKEKPMTGVTVRGVYVTTTLDLCALCAYALGARLIDIDNEFMATKNDVSGKKSSGGKKQSKSLSTDGT